MIRCGVYICFLAGILGCQGKFVPMDKQSTIQKTESSRQRAPQQWATVENGSLEPWYIDLGGVVIATFKVKYSDQRDLVYSSEDGRKASFEAMCQWKEKNRSTLVTRLEERIVHHPYAFDGWEWRRANQPMEYFIWYERAKE